MNNITAVGDDKEAFNQTYKWLRERKDDQSVREYFSELLEHLYWFYNDDEIAESVAKATKLDTILNKYGFRILISLKNTDS